MATVQAKYDQAKAAYKESLFGYLKKSALGMRFGPTADEAFAKIAAYDPTHKMKHPNQHVYLGWMCRMILKDQPRPQDIYKIGEDLDLFRRHRKSLPANQQSIDAFTSLAELDYAVRPFMGLDKKSSLEKKSEAREKATAESTILYDGPAGRILIPRTMEASQFWGQQSRWCISATKSENLFDDYSAHGPIAMFLPKKTADKYAYHEHEKCIRDQYDEEVKGYPQGLRDFLAQAFADPGFHQALTATPEAHMLLQTFMIYQRSTYHALLSQDVLLPAQLSPRVMAGVVAALFEDKDRYKNKDRLNFSDTPSTFDENEFFDPSDNGNIKASNFLRHDKLLAALSGEGMDGVREILKAELNLSELVTDLEDALAKDFTFTEEELASKELILAKLTSIYNTMGIYETLGDSLDPRIDEKVCTQLAKAPEQFWDDPDFTYAALIKFDFALTHSSSHLPIAVFSHPQVFMDVVAISGPRETERMFEDAARLPESLWGKQYAGRTVLEALIRLPVEDHWIDEKKMTDLERLVSAYRMTGGDDSLSVDYSPLSRRVAELYPHGFDNEAVMAQAMQMRLVDLSVTLEATVERHPGFFEDIPPERHTEIMALRAVTHDPEMIIETADRLLRGNPNLFRGAFNRLGLDNPVREARAHYFTENGTDSGAPAPSPPQ